MMLGKIVMFDLYDTLLKGVSFDFNKGVEYLHEEFFKDKCSLEDIIEYSKSFLPLYTARKENNTELCFITDELPLYFKKYGVPMPEDVYEVEYEFLEHLKEDILLDEVKETLESLHAQGIPMYVFSNSIFTEKTASRHIEKYGILEYFEKVFSSGDYGVRKPGKEFFQIAIEEILRMHPEATIDDIFFVGNDYEADAVGGTGAGLKTIWYNVSHMPNEKNLEIWDVDDFHKILELIR
ncbi:MAG: HAD family hydrolase [Agathobacter sp.]|nr:HAD family hydrolase [Agathobacter sp.]